MSKITSWNQAAMKVDNWAESAYDESTPNYKHLYRVFQHYAKRDYYHEESFKNCYNAFSIRPMDRLIWLELMLVYPEFSPFNEEEIAAIWYETINFLGQTGKCFFPNSIIQKYPKVEFKPKLSPQMEKLSMLEEQNKKILSELAEVKSLLAKLVNKQLGSNDLFSDMGYSK